MYVCGFDYNKKRKLNKIYQIYLNSIVYLAHVLLFAFIRIIFVFQQPRGRLFGVRVFK